MNDTFHDFLRTECSQFSEFVDNDQMSKKSMYARHVNRDGRTKDIEDKISALEAQISMLKAQKDRETTYISCYRTALQKYMQWIIQDTAKKIRIPERLKPTNDEQDKQLLYDFQQLIEVIASKKGINASPGSFDVLLTKDLDEFQRKQFDIMKNNNSVDLPILPACKKRKRVDDQEKQKIKIAENNALYANKFVYFKLNRKTPDVQIGLYIECTTPGWFIIRVKNNDLNNFMDVHGTCLNEVTDTDTISRLQKEYERFEEVKDVVEEFIEELD